MSKTNQMKFVSISRSPQLARSSRREIFDLKSLSKISGFTLIELLVVTALIIVLTAIGFVNFRGTSQRTRNSKRQADISQVRSALELYRATNERYPIYSTANRVTNFNNLINDATFSPYLATQDVVDPNNVAPYQYGYQSAVNGFTYSICYNIEPAGTQTCLTNP